MSDVFLGNGEEEVVLESDIEIDITEDLGDTDIRVSGAVKAGPLVDEIFPDRVKKATLIKYLQDEIREVVDGSDRGNAMDMWEIWRKQRLARPMNATKNFPWPKAANSSVPAVASATNTIYASMKKAFSQRRPLFSVNTLVDSMKNAARAMTNFMDMLVESPLHINLRKTNQRIFYDQVSMGTQFIEVPWVSRRWTFKRAGGELVDKIVYDGPNVVPLRLEDVIMRANFKDLQEAPWFSMEFDFFDHELKQQAATGWFENIEMVLPQEVEKVDDDIEDEADTLGLDPRITSDYFKVYKIYKTYVFFDPIEEGDSVPIDLIIWIEIETGTILKAEYNDIGRRQIVKLPYIEIPDQPYGVGVGWYGEKLQEEIDSFHNMAANSTTLSSTQMFVTRRGSGIGPKEKFYPLKNIQVDNPKEDFIPVSFPDVSDSARASEQLARTYLEDVTGATAARRGSPNQVAKSGTSFSLEQFQASQAASIFDAIRESTEERYSEIGLLILLQLVANSDRVKENLLPLASPDDRPLIESILDMNVEDIPTKFQISVKTTKQEDTEAMKKQNMMLLGQMYDQYAQTTMPYLAAIANPQTPEAVREFAMTVLVGKGEIMKSILNNFGEIDTDDYVLYTKQYEMMLDYMNRVKDIQITQQQEQLEAQIKMMGGEGSSGEGEGINGQFGQSVQSGAGPGLTIEGVGVGAGGVEGS